MKARKHSRKSVIILIGGLTFLMLLFLILFRGWVRTTAIRGLVDTTYSRSLKSAYINDFSPVDNQLAAFNLVFSKSDDTRTNCSVLGFTGLKETINCAIGADSNGLHPDDAYKITWKQHSKELEAYLLNSGWQKQWNALQPIDEILDKHTSDTSIGVNYSKTHGKITCTLFIGYNPPVNATYSYGKDRFWTTKGCRRSVDFFGGY